MGILRSSRGGADWGGDRELLDGEVRSCHLAGVAGERGQVVEEALEGTHPLAVPLVAPGLLHGRFT
jgi:hypothetical protein